MSSWTASGRTDPGNVRETNEDCYLVDESHGVFAVADGMGGAEDGDIASEIFVETLRSSAESLGSFARSGDPVSDPEHRDRLLTRLASVFREANQQIYDVSGGKGEMGTTADVVLVSGGTACVGHVGDSRLYLKQGGELTQVTEDHTYANMVEGPTGAEEHGIELDTVLTRAVGAEPQVPVDTFFIELEPGDRLLLCTDGVTKHLDRSEIGRIASQTDVDRLADRVVDETLSDGGLDNATAVAVQVAESTEETFASSDTINTLEKAEFLHDLDLFEGLDERRMFQLIRYLVTVDAEEGEYLIRQGAEERSLYILVSGTVAVRRDGESITHLGPGDHVGEMVLSGGGGQRSADVVATGPVRALELSAEEFQKLVEAEPRAGCRLLENLFDTAVRRLRETTDQLLLSRP